MINELFRTRFESNLTPFVVFLAMNALLGLHLVLRYSETGWRPASIQSFIGVTVWLLACCAVAACLSLLRYSRERRGRLYAQLPVTSLQIRLAYWCHAGLYLCISSLVLLLVMIYAGNQSVLQMLKFTLLYFFHAGALLALVSIVTGNTLQLVPAEIRKRTVAYFFVATFITFLFLFAMGAAISLYERAGQGRIESWSLMTVLVSLGCIGLVVLDVQLFRNRSGYLD